MFFEHLVSKYTEATLKASFQVAFVYSESQPEGWLIALVEIPGFEPGQTEPKSVLLPLHNISIPCAKILLFLLLCNSVEFSEEKMRRFLPLKVVFTRCFAEKRLSEVKILLFFPLN